jgi:hypothetical protein
VLAMGKLVGYPRLEFDRGRSIAPGLESWRKFADHASPADMTLAIAALVVIDPRGMVAIWRDIPKSTGPMADFRRPSAPSPWSPRSCAWGLGGHDLGRADLLALEAA